MRQSLFVFIAIVCSIAPAISEPSAVTKITLTWTDSFDRIEPQPQKNILLQRNATLLLNNSKTIDQRLQTSGGGGAVHWDGTLQSSLGKDWRVLGPNVLRRTDRFPNDVSTVQVTVSGNTCTLTITSKLVSGAPYYIRPMISQPGKAGHYSRMESLNPVCKIE